MGVSLTQKQENFCQSVITEPTYSDAYRKSYSATRMKDATINRKATELMANGLITARLNVLRAAHAERHNITVDGLTSDALRIMQGAEHTEQYGAANAALTLIAKLHGKLVDLSKIQMQVASIDAADQILQDAGMLPR